MKAQKSKLKLKLNASQFQAMQEILDHEKEIRPSKDRLLYGDVGSGKTNVMIACCQNIVNSKRGSCIIISPTTTLANQTFDNLRSHIEKHKVGLAISNTLSKTGKQRRQQWEDAKPHQYSVTVGTTALCHVNNLPLILSRMKTPVRLVFVDEQQKFGLQVRTDITKQQKQVRPLLVFVTATPIPHSVGQIIANHMEFSSIESRHKQKKITHTSYHVGDWMEEGSAAQEAFEDEMRDVGLQTRLLLVVVPCVENEEVDNGTDNTNTKMTDLKMVLDQVLYTYKIPSQHIGIAHGAMLDKEGLHEALARVRRGATKLLITTTVIETGVHLPQADSIIILDAERFGISQLHQLRGRVGRVKEAKNVVPARCLLLSKKESPKLRFFSQIPNTDAGFQLAVTDAQTRGPGNLGGTVDPQNLFDQSGFVFKQFK